VPIDEQALEALNELIGKIAPRVSSGRDGAMIRGSDVEKGMIHARLTAAIERWSGPHGSYQREVARIEAQKASVGWRTLGLFGVLQGLRDDYAAGYMRTVEELVHADLFADFLAMADELVSKGYKDASAVIIGSVLEEHLRKLAGRNRVSIAAGASYKRADTINADLVKAGAYNKLEQKNVTAWLGLRNDAAHGKYDNYDHRQVELLLTSVREFLVRRPA
jgi:hypothetical protein